MLRVAVVVLALARLPALARAGAVCPQIACDRYVRNATWTGRFAIVVSGHVRMLHDQARGSFTTTTTTTTTNTTTTNANTN